MSAPQIPSRRIRARCPRGHGRLWLQQDYHGSYLSCLMCGYVLEEGAPAGSDYVMPLPLWWRDQSA
jgi:hypothetical protein